MTRRISFNRLSTSKWGWLLSQHWEFFALLASCSWLVIHTPVYISNRWPCSTSSITCFSTFPTPFNFLSSPCGFLICSSHSPHIGIHISASSIEGSPTRISRHRYQQETWPHSIHQTQSQKLKVVVRSSSKPQLLFLYSFFVQALSIHNDRNPKYWWWCMFIS